MQQQVRLSVFVVYINFVFITVNFMTVTFLFSGEQVVSVGAVDVGDMAKCNHEETNTCVVVHILHSLAQGSRSVNVRTVDTDVVVILVGKFHDF